MVFPSLEVQTALAVQITRYRVEHEQERIHDSVRFARQFHHEVEQREDLRAASVRIRTYETKSAEIARDSSLSSNQIG